MSGSDWAKDKMKSITQERASMLSAQEMHFVGHMFDVLDDEQMLNTVEHALSLWERTADEIYRRTNGDHSAKSFDMDLTMDSRAMILMLTTYKAMCVQALYHRIKDVEEQDAS